jgi:hypothetical protein
LIRTVRGQGYMVPSEAELTLAVPVVAPVAAEISSPPTAIAAS